MDASFYIQQPPPIAYQSYIFPNVQLDPYSSYTSNEYNQQAQGLPPPVEDIDTLNHRVIQRHIPSLDCVLQTASYTVVYTFSAASETWEKAGVEGTLFTVRLHPLPGQVAPRHAVVILNRRGLDNWMLELKQAEGVQITDEYIILQGQGKIEDALEGQIGPYDQVDKDKIWGLWVFDEKDGSTSGQRQIMAKAIMELTILSEKAKHTGQLPSQGAPVNGHEYTGSNTAAAPQPASPDLMALLNQGRTSSAVPMPQASYVAPRPPNILDASFQGAGRR